MQVFTSSGTFTIPAGITSVRVQVWGAGAGGRAGYAYQGGFGGYGEGIITGLTPGGTVSVTIGTGGNGSQATGSPSVPTAGGTSSFGSYISCTGGSIQPAPPPSTAASAGVPTFSGVTKIVGSTSLYGAPIGVYYGGYGGSQGAGSNLGCCFSPGGGGGGGGFSGGGGGGAASGAGTGGLAGPAFGAGNNGTAGGNSSSPTCGAGGAGGAPGGTGGGAVSGGVSGSGGGGGGGGVVVYW